MSLRRALTLVVASSLVLTACAVSTDAGFQPVSEQVAGIELPERVDLPVDRVSSAELLASVLPVDRPFLDWAPAPDHLGTVTRLAYTDGQRFVLQTSGGDRDFLPGINLGSTVPGRAPGEVAVEREDYRRWFPMMADIGFRVIRVYTILPPAFYEELRRYNLDNPNAPLYLMHGIWVPEEHYFSTPDLFDPLVTEPFHREIEDAVAVLHGDHEIPARPGHASGVYTADVSEWLVGWLVGVEWEPELTHESDLHNEGTAPYFGRYFESTPDASPTAIWMAEALDHLAALQAARGRIMPIGMVNWPTTDPIDHIHEPDPTLRLADVDANHIKPTDDWAGGYFASYHVYPYYPDFLHIEPGLVDFEYRGSIDPYAGYLTQLAEHHAEIPTLITEFGVPAGMALARFEDRGRHQGNHPEQDQMRINAELIDTIHDLGLGGGFVFEWIDEWFKLTWNTLDYEVPSDRRPMWQNTWTNESQFGVIAAVPGQAQVVVVDGTADEWPIDSEVIYRGSGAVERVRARHDESFMYLAIDLENGRPWDAETITVGFDVLEGGIGLPDSGLAEGSDYAFVFTPDGEGTGMVRSQLDAYTVRYGVLRRYFEADAVDVLGDDGSWNPQRLLVRRPIDNPVTGEIEPVMASPVWDLRFGTADPADAEFDSRTVWAAQGDQIEIRLPHMALGFSDPSSLQAFRPTIDDQIVTETVEHVGIAVVVGDELAATDGYIWEPWQVVQWHERPKAGIEILADQLWEILATE